MHRGTGGSGLRFAFDFPTANCSICVVGDKAAPKRETAIAGPGCCPEIGWGVLGGGGGSWGRSGLDGPLALWQVPLSFCKRCSLLQPTRSGWVPEKELPRFLWTAGGIEPPNACVLSIALPVDPKSPRGHAAGRGDGHGMPKYLCTITSRRWLMGVAQSGCEETGSLAGHQMRLSLLSPLKTRHQPRMLLQPQALSPLPLSPKLPQRHEKLGYLPRPSLVPWELPKSSISRPSTARASSAFPGNFGPFLPVQANRSLSEKSVPSSWPRHFRHTRRFLRVPAKQPQATAHPYHLERKPP